MKKKKNKIVTINDGQQIKYKNKIFTIGDGELKEYSDQLKVDFVKNSEKYKVYLSFNKSFPLSDLCDHDWLATSAREYLDDGISPTISNLENRIREHFDPVELMDIDSNELRITIRKIKI